MEQAMGDPTQQDPRSSWSKPATDEQPGDPPPDPAGDAPVPGIARTTDSASTLGVGLPHSGDDGDTDDDDDLDVSGGTIDQAVQEAMIENLIARVVSVRQQWAMLERERYELRRTLRRVEHERDELRVEHARALRRAEAAELRLAEVQARIAALEDSLQQRPRGRVGSAKLPGASHDVGQDFK